MKPRLCSTFRKSDLKAVICLGPGSLLFYGICNKTAKAFSGRLPRMRTLWHYKMCPFGTSCTSHGRASRRPIAMMLTAIGLMSGTSLDGVDVALIETDGRRVEAFGPCGYRPYSEPERRLLRQALAEATGLQDRDARPGVLREAEHAVTVAHAEAVAAFTAQHHITSEDIDIVGFHGQTVLHRPERKMTV